ncbi:MAG TPA: hypothetical protein VFP92_12420, partial [Rhodanobacteraceae bacterium]|nr:hypothetical protein [Rhodanobacteraceae bacterium]
PFEAARDATGIAQAPRLTPDDDKSKTPPRPEGSNVAKLDIPVSQCNLALRILLRALATAAG